VITAVDADKRIAIIKIIRSLTSLGLKEAGLHPYHTVTFAPQLAFGRNSCHVVPGTTLVYPEPWSYPELHYLCEYGV